MGTGSAWQDKNTTSKCLGTKGGGRKSLGRKSKSHYQVFGATFMFKAGRAERGKNSLVVKNREESADELLQSQVLVLTCRKEKKDG